MNWWLAHLRGVRVGANVPRNGTKYDSKQTTFTRASVREMEVVELLRECCYLRGGSCKATVVDGESEYQNRCEQWLGNQRWKGRTDNEAWAALTEIHAGRGEELVRKKPRGLSARAANPGCDGEGDKRAKAGRVAKAGGNA